MKRPFFIVTIVMIASFLLGPGAVAAPRAALTPGSRFLAESDSSETGHAFGWLGVALIALLVAMGFVVSSTRLKLPPAYRKWLRRVHGAVGVLLLVFVIVHLLIVGG
jgi:hypothetical protein